MNRSISSWIFGLTVFPAAVLAQHYSLAYIDIRLVKPDSVHVTVEADGLDLKNAVETFPTYEGPDGSFASFQLYEQRIEAYLQSKVRLHADGKRVRLAVVSWKPGGQGRDDGFDTASVRADNHAITLGGRLPPGVKTLKAYSELWIEKPEVKADMPPVIEYHLFDGAIPLQHVRSKTEQWVRFSVSEESLTAMRKNPLPAPKRRVMGHAGHNH